MEEYTLYYDKKEEKLLINVYEDKIEKNLIWVAKIDNWYGKIMVEEESEIKVKGVQSYVFSWF